MKRTMKKHLSIILAVLMLFSSVGFNVFAAGECQHQTDTSDSRFYKVTNPTCETRGYTEYFCVLCGAKVSEGNYKDPLGHKYGDFKFRLVDENDLSKGYNKYQTCERKTVVEGLTEPVVCGLESFETENNAKTVYYRVTFVHDRMTAEYDSDIKYTNVVSKYKDPVVLQESYIKKGDEANFEGESVHTYKTKEYGQYKYAGWSSTKGAADPDTDFTVNGNTVYYPVFDGVIVYHDVTFYGTNDEQLTVTTKVEHGKSIAYRVNGDGELYDDPVKDSDIVNDYTFAGWIMPGDTERPIKSADVEKFPVYGNISFYPSFTPTKKPYTVEFRDASKNLIRSINGLTLESNLYNVNEIATLKPTKDSDNTYMYTWTGEWQVLRADGSLGSVVDMKNFKVSKSDIVEVKDKNDVVTSRTIMLVPVFRQTLIRYAVEIEMGLPYGENMNYYRGEAEVQVIANNNQLVAAGKTDANGIFRCYLNYQAPFTVNVASYEGKYLGHAIITDISKSGYGDEYDFKNENHVLVAMEKNPEYETHCRCIHHNALLQPIIVRIFNILYSFFNYKYVCCYDMYSTVGPLLEYTAG